MTSHKFLRFRTIFAHNLVKICFYFMNYCYFLNYHVINESGVNFHFIRCFAKFMCLISPGQGLGI